MSRHWKGLSVVLAAPAAKPHKYHAVPLTVDGIRFASHAEAKRYEELRLLERAGKIDHLFIQPKFALRVHDGKTWVVIGHYLADFAYCEHPETHTHEAKCAWCVVEDVKGVRTSLFCWKKKHFEAQYRPQGLTIREL